VSEDISVDRNVSFGPSGKLDQGCFMNADNTSKSANSWAVSSQLGFLPLAPQSSTSIPSISNLTACGISPILNETLLGNTADKQIDPYRSVAYSSIWSWSPGEPRNISTTETNNALIRCAAMDSSLNGRWRVADCTERHYAACRSDSDPYSWRLSESKGTYSSGAGDCPKGSSFSVPRTGLENGHLFFVLSRSDVSDTSPLWVNFNSLNRESCWVAGVNSTCPYNPPSASDTRRDVIMPTIAAVIVFAIAALVVFVKCTANRQKYRRARRRKTSDEGGDYEGVPS
jgi:hypothetical protein